MMEGWSKEAKEDQKYKWYYKKRNELSCEDGCLYYMNRIVIPEAVKKEVLERLHENHLGIVRMKMVGRSYVWWQNFDSEIENFVKTCEVCQQSQNNKHELVISRWPVTEYPMQRIHIDFFYYQSENYLIIVDSFSKYCDVIYMKNTNAKQVILALGNFFSIFGLPEEIVSDNGPPFGSIELVKFAKENGIKLTKSPPYHPQSNGLAERNVQTVKKTLKKFLLEKSNSLSVQQQLHKFLLMQRNTPSMSKMKTPAELIFAYKPKILLDLLNEKNKINYEKKVRFEVNNEKTCKTHKKHHLNKNKAILYLKNFKEGEKVMFQNIFKNVVKWTPARVIQQISAVTYLINVNNHIRFVHQDALRNSTLEDDFHPSKFVSKELDNQENVELRKSSRAKKAPIRLGF